MTDYLAISVCTNVLFGKMAENTDQQLLSELRLNDFAGAPGEGAESSILVRSFSSVSR